METRSQLLVIGAGPTGLAMSKALGEAGVEHVVAEATDHVGGNWAHGVYETAHIISSKATTEYPDWPMPADYPDFPSGAQMKAYYEAFAEACGLLERIRFSSPVADVRPVEGGWSASVGGVEEVFKGVVVCNGHHWSRVFPDWVEQARAAGVEVLHSKDYKRPDQLRGKRVLVLGGGNSGCDIVSEAARVAAGADWSLRRGYWMMPKTLFGRPTVELMNPWMPVWAQRLMIRAMLRVVVGRYADYGLPEPDHRIFEAHPTVSTEVFHYLKHGRITPRPDVAGVDEQGVRFADGTRAAYDLIVCATGYHVDLPMLPEGMLQVVGKTPQVYGGMLLREHRHLYVMGGFQVRYGIGPLLRPLGLMLADWVQLQDQLELPLGEVLHRLGDRPPTTHLAGPHAAIRKMWLGRKMVPWLRWRGRRMSA